MMPDRPKSKHGRLWKDRSHGGPEVETDDTITGEWLGDFPETANRIESRLDDHNDRISSVEESLTLVVTAFDKLIQMKQLEVEAARSASGCNQAKEQNEESSTTGQGKEGSRDLEAMYRSFSGNL